ncbi:MAG: hypothetical protein ABWX88_09180 [Pseudoxanthomonas sp.]
MSLSLSSEPEQETSTQPLPPASAFPDPHTSLERLVHLLQGSPEPSLADVGITRLPDGQLDRLASSARHEAELCQDRAELLLELLERCVENSATPEAATLLRTTRQLHRLARDQRRWHDLADNAAYYRDNAQVAARISGYLSARQQLR